ncbi:phosphatidylinositol glycan, class M, glycosyltransferase family 50 protein [Rhodotorula toruloides]|uniref:GPI mannosyltransferase 1 n=1 Tax=Rhodotorula toruloides TaxID=5286 RepID=A0A511KIL4_RHOTO|nr:phosphatidylinositol glycan, class M, glycosyltransferase family 50 protein [Rhodotorula toruloides]
MRFSLAVGLAAALRVALLLWGVYQDAYSAVRYTDVDYFVFSDAAACFVESARLHCGRAKGGWAPEWLGDPYARMTYRYTPLLAFALAPNSLVHPGSGKVLFSLCDLWVGVMLYNLMRRRGASQKYAGRAVAAIWLLNPMIANISTRGSSESIVGALVVAVLSLASEGRWEAAAAVFGAAVHVKIFPFMYGSSLVAALYSSTTDKKVAMTRVVHFGVLSFACFMLLNAACFVLFGEPFLQETFLYHLSRLDHRHNFSPYFYSYYLSLSPSLRSSSSPLQVLARHPLAAFGPQLTLSLGLGFLFGNQDLPYAWLVQTFAFVAFNKVCTSQAIWLSQAYRLEMLGEAVYREVWLAGLGFLVVQAWVLRELLVAFMGPRRGRWGESGRKGAKELY